jgi:predicted transporter
MMPGPFELLILFLCTIGILLFLRWKKDKEKDTEYNNIESDDTNNKERRKMKEKNLIEDGYKEEDYNAARFISKVIAFIGWIAVAVGIIIAIIGFATSAGYKVGFSTKLLLMLPGLYYSFAGLIAVAFGQIMRATVDNASHTKEIAKNSREVLELKVLEIKKKYKKS